MAQLAPRPIRRRKSNLAHPRLLFRPSSGNDPSTCGGVGDPFIIYPTRGYERTPPTRSLRVCGDEGNLPPPLWAALRMRPAAGMNQQIAAAFLVRAWEGGSTRVLEDAWSLPEPDDDG
jgi:hypothetical protein